MRRQRGFDKQNPAQRDRKDPPQTGRVFIVLQKVMR
jgi:hypothetical protein